ncbi:ATP-grasp domain-containing protein [Aerococcaceae bacterium 50-4]
MNFIVTSPFYPENFQLFTNRLKKQGFNVLGIGQEPYDQLTPALKADLTEYYRVNDLENIDEVKKAVAYLFFKHGQIDRIESQNEHWLNLDAEIREQFNIPGNKPKDLRKVKFKSEMKKLFTKAGVPTVPGKVANKKGTVKRIVKELGLPLVAKPNSGVGSSGTFKLKDIEDVEEFVAQWDEKEAYFFEPYIEDGKLLSYDGLIDQEGNIVFETGLYYRDPTLEVLKHQLDYGYIIQKDIPEKLRAYGQAIVQQFGMKERFFHIEFFENGDDYLAVEYNNRVAGGYAIDMYNFANHVDLFRQYARIVDGQSFEKPTLPARYCVAITHRDQYSYAHDEATLRSHYGDRFVFSKRLPDAFAALQGNQFYGILADTEDEIEEIFAFVHQHQEN